MYFCKGMAKSISNHYAFEVMHFRQIANPQMKMARLKSGDLQPLCKMPSPSYFFPGNFVSRHSFPRGQSIPRQTARRRLPFTNSRPLAPVPISIRSCSPSVSGRRHQFVVKAGRRHQSSRCSSRAAEFREANMGSRVPENGSSRIAQRIAKV